MFIVLGIILGFILAYICLKPKIKQTKELDRQIEEKNKTAYQTFNKVTDDIIEAKTRLAELNAACGKENSVLELIRKEIVVMGENAEKTAEAVQEAAMAVMQESFCDAVERERQHYIKAADDYQKEYYKTMEEAVAYMGRALESVRIDYQQLTAQFADLRAKTNAAVEANKREQEKREQKDFYRIRLSVEDVQEIKRLREVAQYLRDSEPLNKVIYKVYYENPCTDMIGRVVGLNSKEVKTGIYKITNLENGMCYIGQAVNIADRWRQHVKRGTGADTPTRNKLYPAMLEFGVENFTFEIVEECGKELLNEREQFWQEYFKAKEFGYSIK